MKKTGELVPAFSLRDTAGQDVSSNGLFRGHKTILVLFKIECPTCQYALPYLDRIHRSGVPVVGIAQNAIEEARSFAKEYGLTFPVLIDEGPDYSVSKAFAIEHVPSIFLVDPRGVIEQTTEGWVKTEIEEMYRGGSKGSPPLALFRPSEKVADFKAG